VEEIKRILVVSRMTKYCQRAVHYGVSLSHRYGAELYIMHVVHDPFIYGGWNLPMPSLEKEYRKELDDAKAELDEIIRKEKKEGVKIEEFIREERPTEAVLNMVREKKINLLIMLAHEEGRLEHFLFGRSNEEIVRKIPCSILLVKREPGVSAF